jgi:uncharacterized protein DUF1631
MSTDAVSNVVPLRGPNSPDLSEHAQQFEHLLEECRDLTRERLCQSLAGMLDKAADTLWELSKATQDRDTQRLYVEAKEKLLPQRKAMEERFRSRYLAEFDNRAGQARTTKPTFSDYTDTSLELGLVGEDDLNESLKVNEMAGKLRVYCEEELAALDQRVGVLLGDANLQADNNPFSPRAICDAFKHACRDIEPDVRIRMVLIKLFDDDVLDDIRSIYKAVNALLVQHSILPKIRYGPARNQEGGRAPPGAGLAARVRGGAASAETENTSHGGEQDVFSVLQGLIVANSKGMGQPSAGVAPQAGLGSTPQEGAVQIPGFPPIFALPSQADGAAQALLQGAALLGSLTRIQHGDFSREGGALPSPATAAETCATNVLRELKGTSVGIEMGQMDVATLDIMAMLFDQIFEDPKIPHGVKWLIGRLQIPMLKVAILDKTFFSTRTHPARQMLDTLGEIAVGLPADFDSSNPLYKRLETIIEKLIEGFEESLEIFDVLRQELQEMVAQENQRVEEQTRSAAKRIEQKERLGVAKALARDEIKVRLRAGPMPNAVLKFLAQQWFKLLLITYAKRGKDGDAWKSALETMDQLIWSVRSKPSPEERRKLASLLPALLKRLSAGMQIAGTKESTRKGFLADLMKLHTEAMGGPATRIAPAAEPSATAHAGGEVSASSAEGAPSASSGAAAPSSAGAHEPPGASHAAASESSTGDEAEPDPASLDFTSVIVKNPFGQGEIRVDEIELPSIPGAPAVAVKEGDKYSRLASGLSEGTWVEFRDEKQRHQVKLSYVSPFKTTYLFVNWQGQTVGEYSLHELAAELRAGRALVMNEVPLFDRAMNSLMSTLRG